MSFRTTNHKKHPITPAKGINSTDFGPMDNFRKDMIKVENYQLKAGNGKPIRIATKVIVGKDREVKFTEKLSKDEAIRQALNYFQKEGQFADDKRIKKDFEQWKGEYTKVYGPNQTLKRILQENGLTEEAQQLEKTMQMLSHQFHKSEYPERYNGDKQVD